MAKNGLIDQSTQTDWQLPPLVNILSSIELPPFLSDYEKQDIEETIMHLLCDYIESEPLLYADPDFHVLLEESVTSLMIETCCASESSIESSEIIEYIKEFYPKAEKTVFAILSPRRSYGKTYIRRKPNVEKVTQQLNALREIPQPKQRTEEWYQQRWGLMSASNAWKCFSTKSQRNSLIYEKAKPYSEQKFGTVSLNSPLHWGQKYEPVSILLYEKMYETKIEEFGCIPHSEYCFIGASPDGINCDPASDRYGRMLEIKNIVNREINGIPKYEYWIQMQLQMETCNLKECDFLETRFREYETKSDFDSDGTFSYSKEGKHKGIIMHFWDGSVPVYYYAPLAISESAFEQWEEEQMNKLGNLTWVRNIYWVLEEISCVLVLRNKLWFSSALQVMADVWVEIKSARAGNYDQYAPSSMKPKTVQKCLVSENPAVLFVDTSTIQDESE